MHIREHLLYQNRFLSGVAKITSPPLPPIRETCTFFGRQKQHLARISEPSNDDYDNDVSDNFDNNLGTIDDLVLEMTKKYHIT